jgi:hypothetical protein
MKDVDYEEVARQYNKSMFRKLYDGDYGLAKTFWSGFFILYFLLPALLIPSGSIILATVFLIYLVIQLKGVWAAANKYTGRKLWVFFAKCWVVVMILGGTLKLLLPALSILFL